MSMNDVLTDALRCIEKERGDFDKSFTHVDMLLETFGEEDIANRLYEEIDTTIDWEVVADLYAILIWSTSDNGTSLTKTTDDWITQCENERKIQIALNLDTYPFMNKDEMEYKLQLTASSFSKLAEQCYKLIRSRSAVNA